MGKCRLKQTSKREKKRRKNHTQSTQHKAANTSERVMDGHGQKQYMKALLSGRNKHKTLDKTQTNRQIYETSVLKSKTSNELISTSPREE